MLRVCLCTIVLLITAPLQANEKPNIIFILADDLGIHDLGCYGRKDHSTPNLDKLASAGLRFTSAYAACPVCSPTRAAILTGKSPARLHITTFLPGRADAKSQMLLHPKIDMQLPLTEKTLATQLKAHGYATACIGKWHLGGAGFTPDKHGFDFVYAGKANTAPGDREGGKGEYDLTRQAIQFIDKQKEKPFFLYLAHNSPHIPLAARPDLVEKFRDAYNPVYAAVIHSLDSSIGTLLDHLKEHQLDQKTLIIFTSDNGGLHVPELKDDAPTHNTPYRAGKGFLYEGGIRVPVIIRWPGVCKPGSTSDAPIISTDWTPTLLEAAGAKLPTDLDGRSVLKVLQGKPIPESPLYWHMPHYTNQGSRPAGAIREGQWKLIEDYESKKLELYDLAADPSETRNLAEKQTDRAATLAAKLRAWRKEVRAQENVANPDFDPALYKPLYRDVDISSILPAKTAATTSEPLRDWRKAIDQAVRAK